MQTSIWPSNEAEWSKVRLPRRPPLRSWMTTKPCSALFRPVCRRLRRQPLPNRRSRQRRPVGTRTTSSRKRSPCPWSATRPPPRPPDHLAHSSRVWRILRRQRCKNRLLQLLQRCQDLNLCLRALRRRLRFGLRECRRHLARVTPPLREFGPWHRCKPTLEAPNRLRPRRQCPELPDRE